MQKPVSALRVVLKAILLFVIFNLLFAWLNPPVGKLTLYNSLWPGRLRFPHEESPEYYAQGYNVSVIEDFDAMFGSHILSAAPKPADEFRVFLLGDSSTWGGHVSAQNALSEQFNRLDLTACDGRKVRVYNLGFPWPSTLRDILILDRAKQYDPDLVIWLVTLHSFEKKVEDRQFLVPHAERMAEVMQAYNLKLPAAYDDVTAPTFLDKTILGQRKRLKDILLVQTFGPLWAATGIDNHDGILTEHPVFPQDLKANRAYLEYKSALEMPVLVKSLMFDPIRVGHEIASPAPVIVINEPIFIATGRHSDVRYNTLYPRWAYDAYRQSLTDWMMAHNYVFFDTWDALPSTEFANEIFHRDPLGEQHFAELLAPQLAGFTCP